MLEEVGAALIVDLRVINGDLIGRSANQHAGGEVRISSKEFQAIDDYVLEIADCGLS